MRRVIRSVSIAALAVAAASLGASAQTPAVIDMKGTWKATLEFIVEGTTTHNPGHAEGKPAGKYRLRTQEMTYKFEGQEGRRFWGTIHSDHAQDRRQIGSLSPDGKWIYIAGNVSMGDGSIVNADTIELCTRHVTSGSALVGCGVMKRQK